MARRRKQKSDEAPGWVWMLFGLGIGLIIAFGVYVNTRPDATAGAAASAQPQPQPAEQLPTEAPMQPEPKPEPQPEVVAQPQAPEAEAGEDPNRFDFYDWLPSFEVVIPEVETPAARAREVAAIADPGVYVLQAGSFLTETDAEAQRAKLALLGVESRIQHVSIDDRRFHRVRIGPIEDLDELNSIRARLLGADIESIVMRMTQ